MIDTITQTTVTEAEPRERGMKDGLVKRGKTWSFVYEDARTADGTRKRRWVGGFPTRKAARDARTTRLGEIQRGAWVQPAKLTLGALLDKWLQTETPRLAASSARRFRQLAEVQITPALGAVPLARLSPLVLESFYSDLLTSGRKKGTGPDGAPKGLSPTTVRHCHNVIRLALGAAVRWRLVAVNVARSAKAPKAAETEVTSLDGAQAQQLLAGAAGTRLAAFVALGLGAGLRRAESLAARWADLDFETGQLRVAQALEITPEGLKFKAPKTKSGRRTVVLPAVTLAGLREVHREQSKAKLAIGRTRYLDHDLICAQVDGRPWHPDVMGRAFSRLVTRLGLPPIGSHAMRHSNASLLLAAGVPVKAVAERLGHKDASLTLRIYAHVLHGQQDAAAAKLDAALTAATQ